MRIFFVSVEREFLFKYRFWKEPNCEGCHVIFVENGDLKLEVRC